MKKIIYGITLFWLMFIGTINVYASGSITVDKTNLSIVEGQTASFNIIVDNAIARAYIKSSNTSVLTIDTESYRQPGTLKENGSWISKGAAEGEIITHTVPVIAVGKAGDTAKITVEVYDATTYDETTLATNDNKIIKEINVTIIENKVNSYVVTYDANGGENAPINQIKIEGVVLVLQTSKPIRKGYEFTGWNTKADGSGTKYASGENYTSNANLTLYAQWKKIGNVTTNPNTGDTIIFMVLLVTLGALIYSYWYMKKVQEN